MEQSGPYSSLVSIFGFLIKLDSLFTSAPSLNYMEDSDSDSISGQNDECAASPTCGTSGLLPPPSVPTSKLNLPGSRPLPDAVRDREVAMLVYSAYTSLPNGVPKIHSCCANAANWKKVSRAGGVSTGGALVDDKSMTHKSKNSNTHNNKQVKRERPIILTNKAQPMTLS